MSEFSSQAEVWHALGQHSEYKVLWRSGFAYRGAQENEVTRDTCEEPCYPYMDYSGRIHYTKVQTFTEKIARRLSWAAAVEMNINHEERVIHLNGFSTNDME